MKEDILLELLNRNIITSGSRGYYYDIINSFALKTMLIDLGVKYYWLDTSTIPPSFKVSEPGIISTRVPCWKPLIP